MKSIVFSALLIGLLGFVLADAFPKTTLQKEAPQINSTVVCQLCELFARMAELYVKDEHLNTSQVIAKLEGVCAQLPGVLQKDCDDFVTTYLEPIVTEIENGVPASQVCSAPLKLCPSSPTLPKPAPQINSTVVCTLCELFARLAEVFVKFEHLNASEIISRLDGFCATLPSFLQKDCDEFVANYLESLVNEIVAGTPAKIVCESPLKLCPGSPVLPKPVPQINSTVLCTLCELFARLAEFFVKIEHLNTSEIISKLDGFCATLPSFLQKDCDEFVANYLESVVKEIVAGTPANVVCESPLKLCPGLNPRIIKKLVSISARWR